MNKLNARQTWAGALFGVVALVAASCTVDTSKITFVPDDEFNGSGGNSSASGGTGQGGQGGDAAGTGGAGSTDLCVGGDFQCDGKQVQVCAGGAWVSVGGACAFACDEGNCTGVCDPADTQCVATVEQTCSAQGQWGAVVACEFICANGGCTGECEPGAKECTGAGNATPRVCDETGTWQVAAAPCPGNACSGGLCTSCTGSQTRCFTNRKLQTCVSNAWDPVSPADCTNACVVDQAENAACGGVCIPASKSCASVTQVRQCLENGQFGPPGDCGQKACFNGSCVGVCRPGAQQCSGAFIQTCNNSGQWANDTNCGAQGKGFTCQGYSGDFICGECSPKTSRCTGNVVELCNSDGKWEQGSSCDDQSLICFAGACRKELFMDAACLNDGSIQGCYNGEANRWGCTRGAWVGQLCGKFLSCKGNSGACTSGISPPIGL